MVAEQTATTVVRGHGSDANADSYAADSGPAGAADGRNPRAASTDTAAGPAATGCTYNSNSRNVKAVAGVGDIEKFSRGEDHWQTCSWKIPTAVSGMHGDFVEANREKCVTASRDMCSVLAK